MKPGAIKSRAIQNDHNKQWNQIKTKPELTHIVKLSLREKGITWLNVKFSKIRKYQ